MSNKRPRKLPNLPVLGALSTFLLGAALIIFPRQVLLFFPLFLGAVLIFIGLLSVAHSIVMNKQLPAPQNKLLGGMLNIIVGVIFILKRDISLSFLSVLFGLYVLINACVIFSAAIQDRKKRKSWLADLLESFFSLTLGILLLFVPFVNRFFWVQLLGFYFCVIGIISMIQTVFSSSDK